MCILWTLILDTAHTHTASHGRPAHVNRQHVHLTQVIVKSHSDIINYTTYSG